MPYYDLQGEQLTGHASKVVLPEDFVEFWRVTLGEVQSIPIDIDLVEIDALLPAVRVFDIAFSGFGGTRVKAWCLRPRDDTPLPCVVKFLGYNGGRGEPHEHLLWAAAGYAVLVMDTRGQGSGWSTGATADPVGSGPAQGGFLTRGLLDREQYYYRRAYVDACRAVEVARALPAIDSNRVVVCGKSQGGALALAAASLGDPVAAALIDVPFMCDVPRAATIAQREPYLELVRYLAAHRLNLNDAFSSLRYFDGVCLAKLVTAPCLFSVALMDGVCPPSTVYAAFNACTSKRKEIICYPFNDHEGGGTAQETLQLRWLRSLFDAHERSANG
ncbi:MAG: alpha/beta fold hydrolase [Mesorhizobium sp.]|nr:MAG: alpha/beta fold hydrolase [Mesorhizobium sp.]